MKPSNNLENKTPSDTYWRVQPIWKEFQAYTSLEPPQECNQDFDAFSKSRFVMTFVTILRVREILCGFTLLLKRKTGKEILQSSRLVFLEKFWGNNFTLWDAEDNNSVMLNWGGIADLPLLRTLLAIPNILRGFWEVMGSFVLLACASLAASITLLQWLITCIDFTSDSEDSICWCKWSKAVSLNYGSSTSSWKPWRLTRLDLILMMRDIYINPTWTQSKQRV